MYEDEITRLKERAERLEAGEELCDHHWNGSDRCYETYCSGCERHIGERSDETEIPFKVDAFCFECRKTDEERATEEDKYNKAVLKSELEMLSIMIKKYPEEAATIFKEANNG